MSKQEVRHNVRRLLSVPTKPICDRCMEYALGYGFNVVNHVNRDLKAAGEIRRETGTCCMCGDRRLVNEWLAN